MKKILIIMLSIASVLSVAPVLSISDVFMQVWNDIGNAMYDHNAYSLIEEYKPGTPGFRTLQQFTQDERDALEKSINDEYQTYRGDRSVGLVVSAMKEILKTASLWPLLPITTNSLVSQAVGDITKGISDGSFPSWYGLGTQGFINLQKFTQNDMDFLLKGLRKMLTPTNTNNATPIAAILLKASSPQISDAALAQKLTETLKISSSDAEKAVLVMNNLLLQRTAKDITKGISDGSFPRWYGLGTPNFANLQKFSQAERDSLLEGLRKMLTPTNTNNAIAIAAILLKASSPKISYAALAQKLTETLKISSDDAVTGLLFMNNPLFQQTLNDIGKGLNDGSFPYWYKPGTKGFINLQQFEQWDRDFLLKGLRKMLTPTNTNNAIAIAVILLKASYPQINDAALAQKLTETLKISPDDAATGLHFVNNPLLQQTLNDIGRGLDDGSFQTRYKPGTPGFRTLQQFTQNDRKVFKQYLDQKINPSSPYLLVYRTSIMGEILNAASLWPLLPITITSLVLQALNDIIKGLNDGNFPFWYKPGTQGFINLQQFKQADRDSLLEDLRKMLALTNTNNAPAIAAILLKASSPQISDSALAQKLAETLKISSSDAEKAVQQIEEK
ncbi:hypothetical protein M1466_02515 [Candidatus Dependentiae bacterium]|nr:hypothetical protein [Candidatus Dependentiae bacterium]